MSEGYVETTGRPAPGEPWRLELKMFNGVRVTVEVPDYMLDRMNTLGHVRMAGIRALLGEARAIQ